MPAPTIRPRSSSQHLVPAAAAASAGLLLGLSVHPSPAPPLALVALVPLWAAWARMRRPAASFLWAALAFAAYAVVAFGWVLRHALPTAALASAAGLAWLALVLATPYPLATAVRLRLGERAGFAALLSGSLACDTALSLGPWAMPWPRLGHILAAAEPLNQTADLSGTAGLTALVLLANASVVLAWRATPARRLLWLAAGGLLVLGGAGYGWVRLARLPAPEAPPLRLGLVQPATPPLAWAEPAGDTRVRDLLALSDGLLAAEGDPLDLIIWPETALPPDPAMEARVQRWVQRVGTPLLTGAIRSTPGEAYQNAAILYHPSAEWTIYLKHRLVPFAEQVPLSHIWQALERLAVPAGGVPGYASGPGPQAVAFEASPFGPLICFESAFDAVARVAARQGAGWFVVLTQDGWWGASAGFQQHLALARLRAIETRRPLVQVAVTGTTAHVTPDGRVRYASRWMEPTAHVVTLAPSQHLTPYLRAGDVVTPVALATLLLLLLRCALPSRSNAS